MRTLARVGALAQQKRRHVIAHADLGFLGWLVAVASWAAGLCKLGSHLGEAVGGERSWELWRGDASSHDAGDLPQLVMELLALPLAEWLLRLGSAATLLFFLDSWIAKIS